MIVEPIKTDKIIVGGPSLWEVLEKSIPTLPNHSILAITSKIVSICEGRVVRIGTADKRDLIEAESQYYIPPEKSKYDISLTITRDILIPTAGIDESNGNGYYILWPSDPQKTANEIRKKLVSKFKQPNIGVLITDSTTTPMRLGITGIAISYSGFSALNNYIGEKDLFERTLKVTKANVANALAASAVLVMGEGSEQRPLARISDIPFVHFDEKAPSTNELKELRISSEDDVYAPLITSTAWVRGKAK